MERLRKINKQIVDRYNLDPFAVQEISSRSGVDYEYRVDGQWSLGPPTGKPDGKRAVFPEIFWMTSAENLKIAKATYLAWDSLTSASVEKPVNKEQIINRFMEPQVYPLLTRVLGEKLYWSGMKYETTLFVPWGVRPQGQFGEPEMAVLDRIKSVRDGLRQKSINARVLLMPADAYATEVNQQVSQDQANNYFARVTQEAEQRSFKVEPWSMIRGTFPEEYRKLTQGLTIDRIKELIPWQVVEEAFKAAARRSGFTSQQDIQDAAFRYLRERLAEAAIIEKRYKPIKLSAVAKYKDNFVDRDLPRVYVIPRELQFPWLIK